MEVTEGEQVLKSRGFGGVSGCGGEGVADGRQRGIRRRDVAVGGRVCGAD